MQNSFCWKLIISWMHPANERRRYNVTSFVIVWPHAQIGPCRIVPYLWYQTWLIHHMMILIMSPQPFKVPAECIESGPLFTKKTPSYCYLVSHYKPETVVRPSQVYHVNSYTHVQIKRCLLSKKESIVLSVDTTMRANIQPCFLLFG